MEDLPYLTKIDDVSFHGSLINKYPYISRETGYYVIFDNEWDMIAWDLDMPNFVHKSDKNSFYYKNQDRFDRQKELRVIVADSTEAYYGRRTQRR